METAIKSEYEQAIDGEIAASYAYANLLAEEEALKEKIEALKPLVLAELDNYPEKEVKLHGLTFQKKNAAGKWDFSNIPQWNSLKEKVADLEKLAKQKFQAAEKGQNMSIADDDGVEIETPFYTPGKSTFAVLKK